MSETQNIPLEIYTELTPNPATIKFVTNRVLLENKSVDFREKSEAEISPLAQALFELPYVSGVFIANNFVSITKADEQDWHALIPELRDFLKKYLPSAKAIIKAGANIETTQPSDGNTETEARIIELLNNYVRPAVENDGGAIQFKSYKAGVVTLVLQGSCSGCPSSMVTLKAGIEGLLQRMVPEVKEVVAEEE